MGFLMCVCVCLCLLAWLRETTREEHYKGLCIANVYPDFLMDAPGRIRTTVLQLQINSISTQLVITVTCEMPVD